MTMPKHWQQCRRKPAEAMFRWVQTAETINCYNGTKIAVPGDVVVVLDGRTMVMKASKFYARFESLQKDHNDTAKHSSKQDYGGVQGTT
jgi:hypothetical protein